MNENATKPSLIERLDTWAHRPGVKARLPRRVRNAICEAYEYRVTSGECGRRFGAFGRRGKMTDQ